MQAEGDTEFHIEAEASIAVGSVGEPSTEPGPVFVGVLCAWKFVLTRRGSFELSMEVGLETIGDFVKGLFRARSVPEHCMHLLGTEHQEPKQKRDQ